MPNRYSHKIICFSGKEYDGKALVVLANTIEDEVVIDDLAKIGWMDQIQSVICEKGSWKLCTQDGCSQNVVREVFEKDIVKRKALTGVKTIVATIQRQGDYK